MKISLPYQFKFCTNCYRKIQSTMFLPAPRSVTNHGRWPKPDRVAWKILPGVAGSVTPL